MYYVYILRSKKTGRHYTGSTFDLSRRLLRHNSGLNLSTKNGIPWEVVYTEEFVTKEDAYRREMGIKSYKGGAAFKRLVKP